MRLLFTADKSEKMNLFNCTHCGEPVYFENISCENCGYSIGFQPIEMRPWAFAPGQSIPWCANHERGNCNWLIDANSVSGFCLACELNTTIPDLSSPKYVILWQKIEAAKRRLLYALLEMRLPVFSKKVNKETGLAFDFLADSPDSKDKILTGHDNGLITLNISEADDIHREKAKQSMHEPYRTLLGHFRHEIGHYYWDRLIDGTENIAGFRDLFGDDRIDYEEALKKHYREHAPADWNRHFISAYASSHPWEDWAETWAHYMHIIDTVETAFSYGLSVNPLAVNADAHQEAGIKKDPYEMSDFEPVLDYWLPLTLAMNSLNRSMGQPDIYPFVISQEVREKLKFIHSVVRNQMQQSTTNKMATAQV